MSNRPRKVKVPDLRRPDGKCWAQDTRPYSPTSMARCGFQRWHKGKHSWEKKLRTVMQHIGDRICCPVCRRVEDTDVRD